MSLPGLAGPHALVGEIGIYADATDVNIQNDYGPWLDSAVLTIYVAPSVTVSGSSAAVPSLSVADLPVGSTVRIINNGGNIRGAGGKGGDGNLGASQSRVGGGGGGGAGVAGGLGGEGNVSVEGSDGEEGTPTAGGSGGIGKDGSHSLNRVPTAGEAGGSAIECGDIVTTIENRLSGTIWGGGGGGGGGDENDNGGAGGGPAEEGTRGSGPGEVGGAAGYAAKGTAVTVDYNTGTIRGTVGP